MQRSSTSKLHLKHNFEIDHNERCKMYKNAAVTTTWPVVSVEVVVRYLLKTPNIKRPLKFSIIDIWINPHLIKTMMLCSPAQSLEGRGVHAVGGGAGRHGRVAGVFPKPFGG